MSAEGKSIINNSDQIDRGYQKIDERLNALGAAIKRIWAFQVVANSHFQIHSCNHICNRTG